MVTKPAPTVVVDLGLRPGIRTPLDPDQCATYILTYSDVNTINGAHPLEQVALRAYGDSRFWFVIADVNSPKNPADWTVGETILIPLESPMSLIRRSQ